MVKKYNPPVVVSLYLGAGKSGEKLRENLSKRGKSLSEVIVNLLRKADPTLFKGVSDGKAEK